MKMWKKTVACTAVIAVMCGTIGSFGVSAGAKEEEQLTVVSVELPTIEAQEIFRVEAAQSRRGSARVELVRSAVLNAEYKQTESAVYKEDESRVDEYQEDEYSEDEYQEASAESDAVEEPDVDVDEIEAADWTLPFTDADIEQINAESELDLTDEEIYAFEEGGMRAE